MVKKLVKKSPVKRNTKKTSKIKKISSKKNIKRTTNYLLYSLITFFISLILFLVTSDFLESLFGFIMILSGALILLFIILELIYYFLNKK